MRTRTRDNLWGRKYSFNAATFPTSYTSYTWNGKKYYPPWTSLAQDIAQAALVRTAASTYVTGEEITDVCSKQSKDGIWPWNEVHHDKVHCGTAGFTAVSTRGTSRKVEGGSIGMLPPAFSSLDALPQLSVYDAMALYAECYNDLIPQLEESQSLLNAIYELKDFKGLFKYFGRGVDTISKVSRDAIRFGRPPQRAVRRRGESLEEFRERSMRATQDGLFWTGKTAAELDLTYSFVVRPFVNDCAAISTMWSTFSDTIRKLNDQGRVRNVRHATRSANATYRTAGNGQYITVLGKRNVYRLTAEMTYGLKPMSRLDAFMVYSGARVTPKKLWDAVPFSWFIDKFLTIGEALGSFDRSECDYKISRLMESTTSEACGVYTMHPTYQSYSHRSGGSAGMCADFLATSPFSSYYPLSWSTERSYKRMKLEPQYILPPVLPRLDFPECASLRTALDVVYTMFAPKSNLRSAWRTS